MHQELINKLTYKFEIVYRREKNSVFLLFGMIFDSLQSATSLMKKAADNSSDCDVCTQICKPFLTRLD